MRIISKFIDYYDCGQSFGIDPSLLYFRSPERCKFRKNGERYPTALEACRAVPRCNPVYSFSPVLLGFCGKLYRVFLDQDVNSDFHCIQYRSSDLGDLIGEGEQELAHPKIVTSQVAIQRLRSALGAKAYPPDVMKEARAWLEEDPKAKPSRFRLQGAGFGFPMYVKQSKWEQSTQPISHPSVVQLFHLVQAPIFLMNDSENGDLTVVTNISLKDTGFIRFFDPFTAYQEIAMFLGGVLALPREQPPLTVGDDRIIAQQKGFDDMSFRGPNKGEVEARRKANRLRKRGRPE